MKTGIVFEGGAFRTIFPAVLWMHFRSGYYAGLYDWCICRCSLRCFLRFQTKRRNLQILLDYRDDKRYMSMHNMSDKTNRSVYGLEFAYDTIPNKLVPFDYDTFNAWDGEFYAVVTNVLTGKPEYMRYTTEDRTNKLLQATCALLPFSHIFT